MIMAAVPLSHQDLVGLLREGVEPGGTWADLGSGDGAFTLALAELLGPAGRIHSVDRDGAALEHQRREMSARFPALDTAYLRADFTRPLQLPPLDGVVMANSLHFVRDKAAVLAQVRSYLRPQGRLLLVEYDTDRGNSWVPHPFSFATWQRLALESGFTGTRLAGRVPSRVLGSIYSALSFRSTDSSSS